MPSLNSHEFEILIAAPVAITFVVFSIKGFTSMATVSFLRIQSTSVQRKSEYLAELIPAFEASALLLPFSLSIINSLE